MACGGGVGGDKTVVVKRCVPAASSCRGGPPFSFSTTMHSSNRLFAGGGARKIVVQRAPLMSGLSVNPLLRKKFQRPMVKRRAYGKAADAALKQSCLGQRRRMNGMNRILARSGKPLTYKAPERAKRLNSDGEEDSGDEEDEAEDDRPFEPLQLWTSPHQGGERKGLPKQMYVDRLTCLLIQTIEC